MEHTQTVSHSLPTLKLLIPNGSYVVKSFKSCEYTHTHQSQ